MKRVPLGTFALVLPGCAGRSSAGADSAQDGKGGDVLDEALERLAAFGPEFGVGLANHGPMVAEALIALDRSEAVPAWVERYTSRLDPAPSARRAFPSSEWRTALGEMERYPEWVALFENELAERPWREVVGDWAVRLAPGLVAAAGHGVIRTGHASRAIARADTPARRKELARGLAFWAARYETLPGAPRERGGCEPSVAIGRVRLLPEALRRKSSGLILDYLRELERFPPFEAAIDLVDPAEGLPDFLADLTATSAGIYLAHRERWPIVFVHAVTTPGALALIAPHLDPAGLELASSYAWQAVAAMFATFGSSAAPPELSGDFAKIDDLVDRAVANGNAHAIKMAEACAREWRRHPKPVYVAAMQDVVQRMRPR